MKIKYSMLLKMAIDLLIINISLFMVSSPAYNTAFWRGMSWELYLLASFIAVVIFYAQGMYHRLWQFAGIRDYLVLMQGVSGYVLVYYFSSLALFEKLFSPIMVAVLVCVTGFWVCGWRVSWRIIRESKGFGKELRSKPTLIVGAGGAGALVARTLLDNRSLLKPQGFVDDDRQKQGMRLMGLPILGTRRDIPDLVNRLNIEEIIIAIPSVKGSEIKEIVELSRNTSARLKILPSVFQMIGGKIPEGQIRDIQVEDLLNRKPVKLNMEIVGGYITGRVILVTGAGGSVGSELCIQLAGYNPQALVLLGRGENSIYEIESQLAIKYPNLKTHSEIADVRDYARIITIFSRYKPAVVFHAAAHKHVPLMEKNPSEAFKNNVLGTINVCRAALQNGAETFVLISTDKAVNSTSVMGATKQLAEKVVREFNNQGKTRFAAVRFGNVLGSRGSVIPLFKKQIAAGGPVTVTHSDMVRYFMTISEAAQLVIEAGAMARGGEIFVLDMGEPVRIVDLALNMIKLSGYRPGKDIAIKYTGIRPGEKLSEELFGQGESVVKTEHEKIFMANSITMPFKILNFINQLSDELINDDEKIMQIIKKYVTLHDVQGGVN